MNALNMVNRIADRSTGFVWRYIDKNGSVTDTRISDDNRTIVNLSLWTGIAPLENFVWNTVHRQFYQRRDEWFNVLETMHFAMWWSDPGHRPSVKEATGRLNHLNENGNTDRAFGWSHLPEATLWRALACRPM